MILETTNYKNIPLTFVAANITAINRHQTDDDKTNIWVVGSEDEFVVTEPYATIKSKLAVALARGKK